MSARRLGALLTLVFAIAAVNAPPARAASHTARYVAISGWQTAGEGNQFYVPEPAPMTIAAFGGFTVRPTGTKVTVTIADDALPDGSFLFSICQRNEPQEGDFQCGFGGDDRTTGYICYRGPKTLRGLTPNNPVDVIVYGATEPCPDAPTTGTITIEG